MSRGLPSLSLFRLGQSSSSIWISIPFGNGEPSLGVPPLHAKQPELPPASRCIHSTCRMKFSNIRSVRITPVGFPLQMIIPSRTLQVSLAVLTLTQPLRSLPLKRSRHCGTSSGGCAGEPDTSSALPRRISAVFIDVLPMRPRRNYLRCDPSLRRRLTSSSPCDDHFSLPWSMVYPIGPFPTVPYGNPRRPEHRARGSPDRGRSGVPAPA